MSPPTPSKAAMAFAKAFVADTRKMPPPMTIGHEEALVAMLYDRHAASAWQGINELRKDGTRYLLWHPEWHAPNTGHHGSRGWEPAYELGPFKQQPTHGMPLPAAPTPSGEPTKP